MCPAFILQESFLLQAQGKIPDVAFVKWVIAEDFMETLNHKVPS